MRIRCRIGWHEWIPWTEIKMVMDSDREAPGMRRHCFYCGLIQVREIEKS